MDLIVNGSPLEIESDRLLDLLTDRGIDPARQGVAVAVNDTIVPRAEWDGCMLSAGDRVEIVTAMQGG